MKNRKSFAIIIAISLVASAGHSFSPPSAIASGSLLSTALVWLGFGGCTGKDKNSPNEDCDTSTDTDSPVHGTFAPAGRWALGSNGTSRMSLVYGDGTTDAGTVPSDLVTSVPSNYTAFNVFRWDASSKNLTLVNKLDEIVPAGQIVHLSVSSDGRTGVGTLNLGTDSFESDGCRQDVIYSADFAFDDYGKVLSITYRNAFTLVDTDPIENCTDLLQQIADIIAAGYDAGAWSRLYEQGHLNLTKLPGVRTATLDSYILGELLEDFSTDTSVDTGLAPVRRTATTHLMKRRTAKQFFHLLFKK